MNFSNLDEHVEGFHKDQKISVENEQEITLKVEDEEIEYLEILEENENEDSEEQKYEFIVSDTVDCNIGESSGIALIKTDESKHRCRKCEKEYKSFKCYINHLKTHDDTDINNFDEYLVVGEDDSDLYKEFIDGNTIKYVCCQCNTEFFTKKCLYLHIPMHNNLKEIRKKNNLDVQLDNDLKCDLCNKYFENELNLSLHLRAHEENNTTSSLNRYGSMKITKKYENKVLYPCQFCGKEFVRPHEKVKHERIHSGEKPFQCNICGKSFRVSYCLNLHKKTHSDDRPYVCGFQNCDKRFKSVSVYNHHIMTHSDARNYPCPFCPKKFKTAVQLAGHRNSHIKPFSCHICNRPFSNLYSVKNHIKTHDKNNSLQFTCTICGAQYARNVALAEHVKETHPDSDLENSYEEMDTVQPMIPEQLNNEENYELVYVQEEGSQEQHMLL
ncbi:unnamed protein product [Diamesa serratosioi]